MKIDQKNILSFTFPNFEKIGSGNSNNRIDSNSKINSGSEIQQKADSFQRGLSVEKVTYDNTNISKVNSKTSQESMPILSKEEKKFFEKLYPNSSSVQSYQVYQNSGANNTFVLGQIINRRG